MRITNTIKRYCFLKKFPHHRHLIQIIGFVPKEIKLFEEALTHKSIKSQQPKHNERLEYLGDAVFGMVVADYLYTLYPEKNEGFLTQTRSKLVSRKTLNKIASEIQLNTILKHKVNDNQSIFGNALEALIGAIFIEKGYNYTAQYITQKLIVPFINVKTLVKEVGSYKGKLLEWGQSKKITIDFKVKSSKGKDHEKKYEIELFIDGQSQAIATETSIKKAEELAASKIYQDLINP